MDAHAASRDCLDDLSVESQCSHSDLHSLISNNALSIFYVTSRPARSRECFRQLHAEFSIMYLIQYRGK
jgi:hypothetical protein